MLQSHSFHTWKRKTTSTSYQRGTIRFKNFSGKYYDLPAIHLHAWVCIDPARVVHLHVLHVRGTVFQWQRDYIRMGAAGLADLHFAVHVLFLCRLSKI